MLGLPNLILCVRHRFAVRLFEQHAVLCLKKQAFPA